MPLPVPVALGLAVLVYASTPTAPSEGESASLRAPLGEALRRAGAGVIDHAVDRALEERRAGWRSIDELSFLVRGRSAFVRGRRARERVELDEAARLLEEAEIAYAEGLRETGVSSLCAEAALERGVALAELGHADEARAAFRRARSLDASIALTERTARPDVVRMFRELANEGPPPPPPEPPAQDFVGDRLLALRSAPSRQGLETLVEMLGADAAVIAAVAADGRSLLAARVQPGCATEVLAIGGLLGASSERAINAAAAHLLAAPCVPGAPLGVRLDDPRLQPVVIASAAAPRPKPRRIWPWVFAGALGVTAAVIGVTVGVVVSDARYAVRVGKGFGAP